jgi:solute carrier family 35, member F5
LIHSSVAVGLSADRAPSNTSSTHQARVLAAGMTPEYAKGLSFIVAVAIIWSASSVLVQYVYTGGNFHSPFLVTYIGVSLFTLWLLPMPTTTALPIMQRQPEETTTTTTIYHVVSASEQTDIDDTAANGNDNDDSQRSVSVSSIRPWTVDDHKAAARKIAPVWFLANWTYNASLAYTSITSSTVLASTGSIFTFLFALVMQEERFSMFKFVGVLLAVTGSIITALQDGGSDNHGDDDGRQQRRLTGREIWGDALGLMSAVGYGAYAVQTCALCPKDESLYSMKMLLGYIGLYNLVCLLPIVVYICLDDPAQLHWFILASLVVKGLFDNVLSDYLWLRAVVLTSPTTTTVGVGLTIPFAFLSDMFIEHKKVSREQGFGALCVLAGFVLVNIGASESASIVAQGGADVSDSELVTVSNHSSDRYKCCDAPELDENDEERRATSLDARQIG